MFQKMMSTILILVMFAWCHTPVYGQESDRSGQVESASNLMLGYVGVTSGFNAKAKNPDTGEYLYVELLKGVQERSPIKVQVIQTPLFPDDVTSAGFPETKLLYGKLQSHVEKVVPILMMTKDPLDPTQKEAFIGDLYNGLMGAGRLGAEICSSTSFEAWMKGTQDGEDPLTGEALDQAIDLLVEIHVEAISRALQDGCTVARLDMEYLRPVEFTTFTNLEVAWRVVSGINRHLGFVFVRALDDGAHSKDSGLSPTRANRIRAIARRQNAYGTIHVSQFTTRGRIGPVALGELEYALLHGKPTYVLVEIFDPRLPDTQLMKDKIPGYGEETFSDPVEVIIDGLIKTKKKIGEMVVVGALRP